MSDQNPEVKYLIVAAQVRYWDDASVNGVEDEDGTLIPLREDDLWKPVIDLETGVIRDWPAGTTADIHYKVCDAGEYWLGDKDAVKLLKWAGDYVPDRLLCVGDSGYGDYIILKVLGDGRIDGWKVPRLKIEEEWAWMPKMSPTERAFRCAEQLASALLGCSQRLHITLCELNGENLPCFHEAAPGRLENIKAISSALEAFEKLKGGGSQ